MINVSSSTWSRNFCLVFRRTNLSQYFIGNDFELITMRSIYLEEKYFKFRLQLFPAVNLRKLHAYSVRGVGRTKISYQKTVFAKLLSSSSSSVSQQPSNIKRRATSFSRLKVMSGIWKLNSDRKPKQKLLIETIGVAYLCNTFKNWICQKQ